MDINWLQDFVCLSRTLNFTRASYERNITQSALSKRIKALEGWVGAPLLERSSYPIRLSRAGEEFLPVAKTAIIDLLRIRDEIRARDTSGLRYSVFAATHAISITHLPPLVRHLEQSDPSIRTRVMSDNLHECCRLLMDEACDFLLCYRHPRIPITLDENRFSRIDLGVERLIPVSVPNEAGAPVWHLPGERAQPVPHLAYPSGSFMEAVVSDLLKQKRERQNQPIALNVRHLDALSESLKSFAKQGAGLAWLPESSVKNEIEAGTLVPACDGEFQCTLTLSMFAATERLDQTGLSIWALLSAQSYSLAPGAHHAVPMPWTTSADS
ncbi:MAG: LysR family transcriptional regulator [Pseudomonadota bacterium]